MLEPISVNQVLNEPGLLVRFTYNSTVKWDSVLMNDPTGLDQKGKPFLFDEASDRQECWDCRCLSVNGRSETRRIDSMIDGVDRGTLWGDVLQVMMVGSCAGHDELRST